LEHWEILSGVVDDEYSFNVKICKKLFIDKELSIS